MSNARYFADGEDFYRVKYEDDSTEGPYTSPVSAKRQGKSMTKVRENWRGWGESRFLHSTYQHHTEYKVQKLVAQCSDEEQPDGEFEHDAWLMWVDVES